MSSEEGGGNGLAAECTCGMLVEEICSAGLSETLSTNPALNCSKWFR
jgi:hypothetical protein